MKFTICLTMLVAVSQADYPPSMWERAEIVKGKREASPPAPPLSIVNIGLGSDSASVGAGYSVATAGSAAAPKFTFPGYSQPALGAAHLGNLGLAGGQQSAAPSYGFAPQTLGGAPFEATQKQNSGYQNYGGYQGATSQTSFSAPAKQTFAQVQRPPAYAGATGLGAYASQPSGPAFNQAAYTAAATGFNQAAYTAPVQPAQAYNFPGYAAQAPAPQQYAAPAQQTYAAPAPQTYASPTQTYGFLSQGYNNAPTYSYPAPGFYSSSPSYGGSYGTLAGLKNSLNNFLSSFARGISGAASSLGFRPASYATAPVPYYAPAPAGSHGYYTAPSVNAYRYSQPPAPAAAAATAPVSYGGYAGVSAVSAPSGTGRSAYDTIRFSRRGSLPTYPYRSYHQ